MLSAIALVLVISGQAAASPPPQAASGRQAIFDRATQAANDGKCEDAVRDFAALEADTSRKMSPAVAGTIAISKGSCLVRLGRGEEGEAALRKGIAALGPLGAAYSGDVRLAHITLGRLAYARYDYGLSEQELSAALALSKDQGRVEPLLLLARTKAFDKDGKALTHADGADKDAQAAARTMRARILLNQGNYKAGYDELKTALKLQGGLTTKVSLADVTTRGDLALAALLNKNRDDARHYLAYTGAGRMKDAPFASARSTETPICGEEAGLRREDSAVVEFSLSEDGSVSSASPVWSSGDREVALEFARAVRNWSWSPEAAKAVPAFYRAATRVQLRCSTVGERPSIPNGMKDRFDAWVAAQKDAGFVKPESEARAVAMAREALGNTTGPARIAPLETLASSGLVPEDERQRHAEEALLLAKAAGAPVAVRTWLGMAKVRATPEAYRNEEHIRTGMRQLLADPEVAADAIATTGGRKKASQDADQLLAAIVADDRLAKDDPVKVAALLEQSSRAAASGQIDQARLAFERTGLDEAQCALIGPRPALRRSGVGSEDYPMEAQNMGFEGWVRTEFDIQADGRTAGQRAVISYPPFVFEDAATSIAKGMRYEATYRPSGGAACSGQQYKFVFQLP
jgi:outer membrane biosynthesis protein TonB